MRRPSYRELEDRALKADDLIARLHLYLDKLEARLVRSWELLEACAGEIENHGGELGEHFGGCRAVVNRGLRPCDCVAAELRAHLERKENRKT